MADKKISALTAASTPLAGTEVLPIVQSGTTVKVAVENVLTSAQPSGTANTVAYLNGSKQLSYSGNLGFDGSTLTFGVGGGAKLLAFNSQIIASVNTAGSAYTDLTFDANDFIVRTGVGGATESLRVSDAGDVTNARGNLVVGTAGKGIDFSANTHAAGMTSELLNDYEEGTWTPASGEGSATSAAGAYTKIGRQVTVIGTLTFPSQTSGNIATITGLPFAIDANGSGATIRYTDYGSLLFVYGNASASTISLFTLAGAGISYTDFSGKRLDFVMTYFV